MPTPNQGESQKDFVSRCIPIVLSEGTAKDQSQAAAVCNTMFTDRKMKTVTVDGFESPEFEESLSQKKVDILGSTYASCRLKWVQGHPDDRENQANKTSCAKIAWSAVNNVEMKMDTAELHNVEILKNGSFREMHNRPIVVDNKLMKRLQDNFDAGIGEPVLTINHSKKETKDMNSFFKSINLGIVSKLKQVGESMFADFKDVPKRLAEWIKSGRMIFRSSEWSPVFQSGDAGVIDNVLTGVTFHGGADGASAISGLSNDFEAIGLKLFPTEQQNSKNEIISVDFKTLKGGKIIMDIPKDEYDELKRKSDSAESIQEENVKLKTQIDEAAPTEEDKKKTEESEKELVELKKFKEDKQKDDEVNLKKEAGEFADKLIKDQKLKPADKDDIVDDYINFKSGDDEDKFNRFLKRHEESDKIINLGQITKDEQGNEIPNIDVMLKSNDGKEGNELNDLGKSTDDIEEQIQLKMKKDGITWDEASTKLGVFNENDFTTKLNTGGAK